MWQPDSSIHDNPNNQLSTILVYYIYILCIGFVTWCSSKKQGVSLKTSLCAARRGAWRFAPLAHHSAPQSLGHGDLDLTSHWSQKHVSFLNAEYRIVYAYVSKSISIIYIYILLFLIVCDLVLALMSWNQVHQRLPYPKNVWLNQFLFTLHTPSTTSRLKLHPFRLWLSCRKCCVSVHGIRSPEGRKPRFKEAYAGTMASTALSWGLGKGRNQLHVSSASKTFAQFQEVVPLSTTSVVRTTTLIQSMLSS